MAAAATGAFTFGQDGNVVGPGAEWTDALIAFEDGNDDRQSDTNGPRFDDHEDIDKGHLWIDLNTRRIYFTLGFMAQVYPNRQWTYLAETRDRGHHGWYFDVDNNDETGLFTGCRGHHSCYELNFAYPKIGSDFTFELTKTQRWPTWPNCEPTATRSKSGSDSIKRRLTPAIPQ